MIGPNREADFTLEADVGAYANARARSRSAAEAYQFEVYEAGKAAGCENPHHWFKSLYEILIGSQNGPHMDGFIALYGFAQSRALIAHALG